MDMKQEELERPASTTSEARPLVPAVDILEDKEGIRLVADLPGVSKDQVSIGVDGDNLTIEGIMSLGETAQLQPLHAEIRVAQYRRSFVLSRDLDTSRIEAQMKNGVLTLRIPKQEQAKPRRIEVRAE